MPSCKLSSLFTIDIAQDVVICGVAIDSRAVNSNFLFMAINGIKTDGHLYIRQAIELGATVIVVADKKYINEYKNVIYLYEPNLADIAATVVAKFYDYPSSQMKVVGVTGTNGKTSITHYIQQIFSGLNESCGVIGTLGISYKAVTLPTKNTTPDYVSLQETFYNMYQSHVSYVAMEVSSHALDQGRCNEVVFDAAIISNITRDHLDYHGSFEAYTEAKLKLFKMPHLKMAIINADDASVNTVKESLPNTVELITYSIMGNDANYSLSIISSHSTGYYVKISVKGVECNAHIPLIGLFNLSNILSAIAYVHKHGFSLELILAAVEKIKPALGRMELVSNQKNIVAVVDYAHTPDALEQILKSLKPNIVGKMHVVFGCGGDRDAGKRPLMAAVVEQFADLVIVTADNPRNELLDNINKDICLGFSKKNHVVINDRKEAIYFSCQNLLAGDCIVVAGKGHEKEQIIGAELRPFDDVKVLAEALNVGGLSC